MVGAQPMGTHLFFMHRLNFKTLTYQEAGVDMAALSKTYKKLKRKPPAPVLVFTMRSISCIRAENLWMMADSSGQYIRTSSATILSGGLRCRYAAGCDTEHAYIGRADGKMKMSIDKFEQFMRGEFIPRVSDKSKRGGRKLTFDGNTGQFHDKKTGVRVVAFKKLLLLPNCKALYWPL